MRAVVYRGVNDFRVEEVPTPEIVAEEILVKVRACGLCSTDVFKANHRRAKPGSVLGHEISGDVARVGSGITVFKARDRVAVLHHAPCGACYFCRHGQEPLCDQYRRTNVDPGGFAEYIRVMPELLKKTVIKLPDDMTYEEGSMIEPTACAVRAVTKSEIVPGDAFLVVGGGPLGLLNAQLAKHMGASPVIVSCHHDFRVEMAKKLGVDYAYNARKVDVKEMVKTLTQGRGPDVALIAVASTKAVHQGIGMVRTGGKVCIFGDFRDVPQPSLEVDPRLMLRDDVKLYSSWGCSPQDYHVAFEMIRTGRVRARDMVTHRFSMDGFTEALKVMAGRQCLRMVMRF